MADLGNRTNVNTAINTLLNDAQPDGAILPSLHNQLIKDILDTLSNGLSTTLRTNNSTGGNNINVFNGDYIIYNTGGTNVGNLNSLSLTATRNWSLPNASGTIALLSNIPTLLDGNGTTAGLDKIDLGGILTQNTGFKSDSSGTRNVGFGIEYSVPVTYSQLNRFDVYATVGMISYTVGFQQNEDARSPAGNVHTVANSSTAKGSIETMSDVNHKLEYYSNLQTAYLELNINSAKLFYATNSLGAELSLGEINHTFTDSATLKRGIQYGSDYSATYLDRSLIDKGYLTAQLLTAFKSDEVDQFTALTEKQVITGGDNFVIEDNDDSNVKKKARGYSIQRLVENMRISSSAGGTVAASIGTYNQSNIIATQAVTIQNPVGSAQITDGIKYIYRISNNGTGYGLSWGNQFRAIGVATLPTTLTANKIMYVGIIYNLGDLKWDVVSIVEES